MTYSTKSLEFDQLITPDGQVFYFHDALDKFIISFTGYGMPPITYVTQRGPLQHGVTPLGYRVEPRTIQLVHRHNGCSRKEYWDNRFNLIDHLRPNRRIRVNQLSNSNLACGGSSGSLNDTGFFPTSRLRKVLECGTTYDLNVLIQSGPRFEPRNNDEWDEWGYTETLRFIAHDPIFYNPVQTVVVANIVDNDITSDFGNEVCQDGMLFPVIFNCADPALGEGVIKEVEFDYNGTFESFPIIQIKGPANTVEIINQETSQRIKLDYNVKSNEVVTMDLGYGSKKITNNFGQNLIGTATDDSDIATFAIPAKPHYYHPDGKIVFTFLAANVVAGQTEFSVIFNERFIGI